MTIDIESKVYEKIKNDTLKARRDKNKDGMKTLIPLLSDIQKIGKDQRREITDNDCYSVIKSTVKNINIVIDSIEKSNLDIESKKISKEQSLREINLLNSYMPNFPSFEELYQEALVLKEEGKKKGEIIKELKDKYGVALDVKELASKI